MIIHFNIIFAEEQFRAQLLDVEKENTTLKRKVEELEEKLHEKEAEYGRLSKKMRSIERDNDSLQKATHIYEQQNRDLEREVSIILLSGTVQNICFK